MVLQSLRTAVEPDGRSSTDMHHTYRGEVGGSNLVPEFRQMFVEISGDFLVFFLEEKKKGKKQSFFIGWALGVLQLLLLVLELLFPLVE